MSFEYNAMGVKPGGGIFTPIPEGTYVLRVVDTEEGRTKNGDYKVTVHYKVHEGEYAGRKVNYHTVTFFKIEDPKDPPPGAGIALHYLHCLGEPYEGKFAVKHTNWRGKLIKAEIAVEEYMGKLNNKIKGVEAVEQAKEEEIEQVPF